VIVSFHSPKGPLSFPCDTFDSWEDNLRAIALALEALRKVDRYGVTSNAEQYKGFAQLPAPEKSGANGFKTPAEAAHFIAQLMQSDWTQSNVLRGRESLDTAYKYAARKAHPDTGGSHESFVKLQAARDYIASSYGW
jgi:hypothetical protein